MKKEILTNLFADLLNVIDKNEINEIKLKIDLNDNNIYSILDKICLYFYTLYNDSAITIEKYNMILNTINKYYNKSADYIYNRIDWITEAYLSNPKISLDYHHQQLLSYFKKINIILNKYKIDYFHASGFIGYILSDKKLERFHHDIDLYVNEKCLNDLIDGFLKENFDIIYTHEKYKENLFRHGFKIKSNDVDIPIWLSFYECLSNGAIYVKEYYEDKDKNQITKRNYNTPLCTLLSLTDGNYNGIKFKSMSLEALYCSKNGNRKKDIYDCKVIKELMDMNKAEMLKQELIYEWEILNYIPTSVTDAINKITRGKELAYHK